MNKSKHITEHKLKAEHKTILIQLLAGFYGNDEAIEYLKNEFGIQVTSGNISFYRKQHEDDIIQQRMALNEKLLAIPIANKFYRLEERQKLLDDLKAHMWYEVFKMKDGQVVLDEKGNQTVLKLKGNHGVANQIMDSVKSELEPNKLALTNPDGTEEYAGFTDYKRRMERLIELCDSIRKRRDIEAGK